MIDVVTADGLLWHTHDELVALTYGRHAAERVAVRHVAADLESLAASFEEGAHRAAYSLGLAREDYFSAENTSQALSAMHRAELHVRTMDGYSQTAEDYRRDARRLVYALSDSPIPF